VSLFFLSFFVFSGLNQKTKSKREKKRREKKKKKMNSGQKRKGKLVPTTLLFDFVSLETQETHLFALMSCSSKPKKKNQNKENYQPR
jgi:hypothetical protein